MANSTGRNSIVNGTRNIRLQMRDEVASKLGILDKVRNHPEQLTVQEAGALGGNITRTLVKQALKDIESGRVPLPEIDVDPDNIEMVAQIEGFNKQDVDKYSY